MLIERTLLEDAKMLNSRSLGYISPFVARIPQLMREYAFDIVIAAVFIILYSCAGSDAAPSIRVGK